MSYFEFNVPIQRDDLLQRQQGRQYYVRNLVDAGQVKSSVHELTVAFSADRVEFVLDKFDLLFSALVHFHSLKVADREQIWELIVKGYGYLTSDITNILELDVIDSEVRCKYMNLLKMATYLLCQMADQFESAIKPTVTGISDKGRDRGKTGSSNDSGWDNQRLRLLRSLYCALQLQLRLLWDPPSVDEEFVNLIGNVCYRFLERPLVAQAKQKPLRESVAQVLATLVRSYDHSHCCSIKIVQLLQQYEHTATILAQAVCSIAEQCGSGGLVADIVRELAAIDSNEWSREGAAVRHYAEFLSQLASLSPQLLLNNICLLVGHLDGECYAMRNAVLSMLGDMVSTVLTGEQLDLKQKKLRDQFLDHLRDHIHDVNAFVRTKSLQIWRKLCLDGAVPLRHQGAVLSRAVGRLSDKSSNVRKASLQLLTAFLQMNPFAAKLPVAELESQYLAERQKLEALGGKEDVEERGKHDEDDSDDDDDEEEGDDEGEEIDEEQNCDDPGRALDKAKHILVALLKTTLSDEECEKELAESRQRLLQSLVGHEDTDAMEMIMEQPQLIPGYSQRLAAVTGESEQTPTSINIDQLVALFNTMSAGATDGGGTQQSAARAQIDKQKMIVMYFKDSVQFARVIDSSISLVCNFLNSGQISDILEAVSFFVTAFEFGLLKAMVGVRGMLSLIWSRETSVREAVVSAYRRLYVPNSDNARSRASGLVSNLAALCSDASVGELAALEELVTQLSACGDLDDECVQLLWQRFTRSLADTQLTDSLAALTILSMAANREPSIVSSNVDVLIEYGLKPINGKPLHLPTVRQTCAAFLKMAPAKVKPDSPSPSQRLSSSHALFPLLSDILVDSMTRDDSNEYSPMSIAAIDVIFQLCDQPGDVVDDVLRRLMDVVRTAPITPTSDSSASHALLLARLLCVCGHSALAQLGFLDVHVFAELKRRHRLREEGAHGGTGDGAKRRHTGVKRLSQEGDGVEDEGLTGAVADDLEAERISDVCENHIVTGSGILAQLLPLMVEINTHPESYTDARLRASAALALCKYMTVSSIVCEQNLQLLFTILELSEDDGIKANIIIALGDMTFRFPNLIEPWTSRIYSRLRDESVSVRQTTLTVLTHLILNDMVKVKGQISDVALRIIDPVDNIKLRARAFFAELASKGNSLYNVMADIISRLSDAEASVAEHDFQTILKFILGLIQKDRQLESLVEKLCLRFTGAVSERLWRDLAFCLSLLNFSERCVKKLSENFSCFSDKLHEKEVYDHFVKIIANAKKTVKSADSRAVIDELESRLSEAHRKASEDNATVTNAAKVTARSHIPSKAAKVDGDCDNTDSEPRPAVKCLTPRRSVFSEQKLRRTRSIVPSQSDSDSEGVVEAPQSPPRRSTRRTRQR